MVGKKTWYRATSSITCALFDRAKFFDKHGCLKKAIAEKNGTLVDNFVQTNRQATGDLLEPVLITEEISDTHPIGGTIISPLWPFNSRTIEVVI